MTTLTQSLPETTHLCPPLQSGDRLTRVEFHRRYCQHPEIKKAELVEGVVVVSSPVSKHHSTPHNRVAGWLAFYAAHMTGVEVETEISLILDSDNEVHPDVCMYYADGRSVRVGDDDYLHGAPELIVEIAASSASYDLHSKLNAYRRNGVQEYVVWRTFDKAIDWFELREGAYHRIEPDEHGVIHSSVFPGLRLSPEKMLAGDMKAVLRELRRRAPRA